MSEGNTIRGQFIFDELTDNSKINGVLILNSKERILLEGIDISAFLELRGRLRGVRPEALFEYTVKQNIQLEKEVPVEIPFQFNFRTRFYETYVGKNFSFSYICEASLRINEKDKNKVDLSFYDKMKGLFSSNSPYVLSSPFEVKYPNFKYQVVESEGKFGIETGKLPALIFLVFAGLVSIVLLGAGIVDFVEQKFDVSFDDMFNYVFLGVLLVIFLGVILKVIMYVFDKIAEKLVGSVEVKVKNADDGFACSLIKPANFRLMDQSISYKIIEKVEDNRGTSSSTYTEIIYTSPKQKVSEFENPVEISIKFPERTGLETKAMEDVSIYWELNFAGRYLGLGFNYVYQLDVVAA